jgi:hypothetical protein
MSDEPTLPAGTEILVRGRVGTDASADGEVAVVVTDAGAAEHSLALPAEEIVAGSPDRVSTLERLFEAALDLRLDTSDAWANIGGHADMNLVEEFDAALRSALGHPSRGVRDLPANVRTSLGNGWHFVTPARPTTSGGGIAGVPPSRLAYLCSLDRDGQVISYRTYDAGDPFPSKTTILTTRFYPDVATVVAGRRHWWWPLGWVCSTYKASDPGVKVADRVAGETGR